MFASLKMAQLAACHNFMFNKEGALQDMISLLSVNENSDISTVKLQFLRSVNNILANLINNLGSVAVYLIINIFSRIHFDLLL